MKGIRVWCSWTSICQEEKWCLQGKIVWRIAKRSERISGYRGLGCGLGWCKFSVKARFNFCFPFRAIFRYKSAVDSHLFWHSLLSYIVFVFFIAGVVSKWKFVFLTTFRIYFLSFCLPQIFNERIMKKLKLLMESTPHLRKSRRRLHRIIINSEKHCRYCIHLLTLYTYSF